jgi:uncharacterized SAM-binding protein YcdF (DUF218 family)
MTNKETTDYIFLENKDLKGDIAFVFGTWNARKESVKKAVELYENKLVPKIIFSGGKNRNTGIVEGVALAQEAINAGVSQKDILIEDESTNTLENVVFSIHKIDEELGLNNIKFITVVAKNYHIRRVFMTLRKHLPRHIQLRAAPYTSDFYPFTKENWWQSDLGKEKVLEEVEKIKTYLIKGDLAEL